MSGTVLKSSGSFQGLEAGSCEKEKKDGVPKKKARICLKTS